MGKIDWGKDKIRRNTRAAIRDEKHNKPYRRTKPITTKQKGMIKELGGDTPKGISCKDASMLIDRLLASKGMRVKTRSSKDKSRLKVSEGSIKVDGI